MAMKAAFNIFKELLWTLFFIELFLLLFTSCDYKELCYDHPHNTVAKVKIPVDWAEFDKEQPTGMTVMAYPLDGGEPKTLLTNDLRAAELSLEEGQYNVLVFNQSTTEFGSFHFEGMDQYSKAKVLANPTTSRWYKSRSNEDRTISEPEWLATGKMENLTVTHDMVKSDTTVVFDTITPLNVVYTVSVRVHVKGIYNVRSARASLSGMAEGYELSTGKPTTSSITQLLESWTLTHDKDNPSNGVLSCEITSFGLPANHQNIPSENEFNLSLLLVDNKTQMDYTFEIGDKFVKEEEDNASSGGNHHQSTSADIDLPTETEVELSLSVETQVETTLPDVKPEGGSAGGFDATVEDWGDEEHIDIGV